MVVLKVQIGGRPLDGLGVVGPSDRLKNLTSNVGCYPIAIWGDYAIRTRINTLSKENGFGLAEKRL